MKYCEHCGKSIDEDSKFCKYCGSSVFNENKIKYYLAIIVSVQQDTLSSFYDILLNNAVNFTVIDANSIINQKYNIEEEVLMGHFNFSYNKNYALLFDEKGKINGEFNIGSEYSRFKTAHFLSNSPYLILPVELLGKKENVIQRYISEKNSKPTLSLEITDCYEDEGQKGSKKVQLMKKELDKHDIANYIINTWWREQLEYARYDCEYGKYRPYDVSVGAIQLSNSIIMTYGANCYLDFGSEPFRVPELLMALKNPQYKVKHPLDESEEVIIKENDFLFNKYFMFINITTDRPIFNEDADVNETNSHNWPRLTSISWLISDCEMNIKHIEGKTRIILLDSENKNISSNANTTNEEALLRLNNHINSNDFTLVGHNVELIKKTIIAECYEIKNKETFYDEEEYYWYENLIRTMKDVKSICTMAPIINLLKDGANIYQQKDSFSLKEAYNYLFKDKKISYNDYAIDVFNCYSQLLQNGLVENPYSDIVKNRNDESD